MKTQQIKRSDLKIIFDNVCSGWKSKISEYLLWESGEVINVSEDLIYQGYSEADTSQKKLIDKYFKIKEIKNLFTLTSFSEVCEIASIKELVIKDFEIFGDLAEKMLNLWRIKVIEKVYNQGWTPDFSNGIQIKWYPYFATNSKGLLGFCCSCDCYDSSYGFVGLYKDQKTSDFVGKTFKDIYIKVI